MLAFLRQNAPWLVAGMLLTFSSSFGQTFFIALFGGQIREEFGLSNGEFGGLYLLGTLGSAAVMVFVGKVVDFYSPRQVGAVALLGLGVASAAMAIADSLTMLVFTIFLIRFFGQGMMSHTALTAMGRWFDATRGKAVSITNTGHQIGEAVLPLTVVLLIAVLDWRQTWLIFAGVIILLAIPALWLLLGRDRVPQNTASTRDVAPIRQWTRSEMVHDPLFWIASFGYLSPPFIGTAIFFHQVYMVELKGWELSWFASGFSIYALVTFIFGLITGYCVDRFSARALLPYFLFPLAAALLVLSLFDSPWSIPLVFVLLGLNGGGFSTLFGALWPEIYGVKHLGEIRSLIVALMVFASALGPGVIGWLIDYGVALETQFLAMSAYCIVISGMLFGVSKAFIARQARETDLAKQETSTV
ncbi:MFS transporter [Pararhizobium sp. IMCC21322]|uniref:MFS transporter n=1 Tax=Pararhizobium sp. IMCC21322 TaxID=3067903 RepID=UPI002740C71D|nr:MFS transporter [Pararhizobium sp. IMCC21322]